MRGIWDALVPYVGPVAVWTGAALLIALAFVKALPRDDEEGEE